MHSTYELQFLDGLKPIVRQEALSILTKKDRLIDSRLSDNLKLKLKSNAKLETLKTISCVYSLFTCNGKKPTTILGDVNLKPILAEINFFKEKFNLDSFRLSIPGKSTTIAQTIIETISNRTGLEYVEDTGKLLIRARKSIYADDSWDVLIRNSIFPLSRRNWRIHDFRGAVNANIASAMIYMSQPNKNDNFINLMSGSGTLLIERGLAMPANKIIGVESNNNTLNICRENIEAAKIENIKLYNDDIRTLKIEDIKFDTIVSDPPWGETILNKDELKNLYYCLFELSNNISNPNANLIILSQEIKLMENLITKFSSSWELVNELRVFQGGYHPHIYHFSKKSN